MQTLTLSRQMHCCWTEITETSTLANSNPSTMTALANAAARVFNRNGKVMSLIAFLDHRVPFRVNIDKNTEHDMKLIAVAMIVVAGLLSGCAGMVKDPYAKDQIVTLDSNPVSNKSEKLKLTYMARNMQESDNRANLVKQFGQSPEVKQWAIQTIPAYSQLAGDVITKQFDSSLGTSLGAAGFAASLVIGQIDDGSEDKVSEVYLPEKFNGQVLDTQEKAAHALAVFNYNQIKEMAAKLHWGFKCLKGCKERSQVFELTTGATKLPAWFEYQPKTILVKSYFSKMAKVNQKDPISAALGFEAKWTSPSTYSNLMEFYSEPQLDENGNVKIFYNKKTAMYYPGVQKSLRNNRVGMLLHRMYNNTPYTFQGSIQDRPFKFYRNGKMYTFYSNGDDLMVNREVTTPDLYLDR